MTHEWLSKHEHLITNDLWIVVDFRLFFFCWEISYQHPMTIDIFQMLKSLRHLFFVRSARRHSNEHKYFSFGTNKKVRCWTKKNIIRVENLKFLQSCFFLSAISIDPFDSPSTQRTHLFSFFMSLVIYRHNLSHDSVKLIHRLTHEWARLECLLYL